MSQVLSGCDFVAGWVSGVCGLLVGHPLDTIKVWKQTLPGHASTTKVLMTISKHEGVKGFYKGLMFPLISAGAMNAVFFGVYGNTLRMLKEVRGVDHRVEPGRMPYKEWSRDVFLSGCVAGFVSILGSCPVELVKTQMQTQTSEPNLVIKRSRQYSGPWECLVDQYRSQGLRGLYRGFIPLVWRDVPTFGLYVLTYEYLLLASGQHGNTYPSLGTQILGGALAGFVSWASVVPLDVIKNRVQADSKSNPKYKGMVDCAIKSYRTEGLPVFFRGFWIIVLRSLPVNAVTFVSYQVVLTSCQKHKVL